MRGGYLAENRQSLDRHWPIFKDRIKKLLESGRPFIISAVEPQKTRLQEMKFNAMIRDIVGTGSISCNGLTVDFFQFGESRRVEYAKALLVRWFQKECELNGEPLRRNGIVYLDPRYGDLCNVRPSTTQFSVSEGAMFIEFLYAEGANAGAIWSEEVKSFSDYPESSR